MNKFIKIIFLTAVALAAGYFMLNRYNKRPKLVEIEETIKVVGIAKTIPFKAGTENEMQEIHELWSKFAMSQVQKHTPNLKDNARNMGVYTDYANNSYLLLAGTEVTAFDGARKKGLATVEIPAGTYLVFSATGEIPETVTNLWKLINDYFKNEKNEYTRLFKTDFEQYTSPNKVEIYISVASKRKPEDQAIKQETNKTEKSNSQSTKTSKPNKNSESVEEVVAQDHE